MAAVQPPRLPGTQEGIVSPLHHPILFPPHRRPQGPQLRRSGTQPGPAMEGPFAAPCRPGAAALQPRCTCAQPWRAELCLLALVLLAVAAGLAIVVPVAAASYATFLSAPFVRPAPHGARSIPVLPQPGPRMPTPLEAPARAWAMGQSHRHVAVRRPPHRRHCQPPRNPSPSPAQCLQPSPGSAFRDGAAPPSAHSRWWVLLLLPLLMLGRGLRPLFRQIARAPPARLPPAAFHVPGARAPLFGVPPCPAPWGRQPPFAGLGAPPIRTPRLRAPPLHGVPGYAALLGDLFTRAEQDGDCTRGCAVLCVDMGHILHTSVTNAANRKQLLARLYRKLAAAVEHARPTDRVCLFFDGPSPHAKMVLSRRNASRSNRPDFDPGAISRLDLTTGSELMYWVMARIAEFRLPPGPKLHISGVTEPGEADLKMVAWLVRHRRRFGPQKVVIVGDDYDLVVLALCAQDYSDLAVLRSRACLPVGDLLRQLQEWPGAAHRLPRARHPMRLELSVVTIMTGTDYFPGLAVRSSLLWNAFKKRYRGNLTATGAWAVADNLIMTPDGRIRREGLLDFLALLEAGMTDHQLRQPPRYDAEHCRQLLEGYAWCMAMYTSGECPDPRWYFGGQAVTPPSLRRYLLQQDYDLVPVPRSDAPFVSPLVAALATLPYTGRGSVPAKYRGLFEAGSPLADLFPPPCAVCDRLRAEMGAVQEALQRHHFSRKRHDLYWRLRQHCGRHRLCMGSDVCFDTRGDVYVCGITVEGCTSTTGTGASERLARHRAAHAALEALLPGQVAPVNERQLLEWLALQDRRVALQEMHAKHIEETHPHLSVLPLERIERAVEELSSAEVPV